ncbi:tRNA (guanine(9)-N(1))-methyltransferase [Microsporum canis]|uniref:tRNA (guanine(9)-N1)-methyltransferase n=1 Tax=Arthroderma otae (strain ATCC MYA-4605 / CBS 113480) TaxID=554155 RepID=C5FTR6_ARTOC|nr:tRNA m(1)G methyltransferase domain-containing protein [Microsporum canis CBS 113480]EEQ33269.1 tRNA m(1)G methyltransferase domain-containing protein [Microsporum canis CBS 113480]
MEAEERPRKLQKTEHEVTACTTDSTAMLISKNIGDGAEPATRAEDCDEAAIDAAIPSEQIEKPLSKNQLKKLARQRKWEAGREKRKEYRKDKLQAKRERSRALKAELRANGETLTPGVRVEGILPDKNKLRKEARARAVNVPLTFIIDCDFDDLMSDKEHKSLSSQITRSYSDNAKAPYRASLVIASFHGQLKERFDTTLSKHYENWKGVKITDDDFATAAEAAQARMQEIRQPNMKGMFAEKSSSQTVKEEGEVVYLTSDSPDTLTELKPYSTYIIGGIVDKNRHKGICYQRAMEKGIKTAKLPIGDYMQMASRFVLATNHVLEIMIKWLELGDWGKAFALVMPKRKGGRLKSEADTPASTEDGHDEDSDREDGEEEEEPEGREEGEGRGSTGTLDPSNEDAG